MVKTAQCPAAVPVPAITGVMDVLVVDDEAEVGEMIADVLHIDGHRVEVVRSGEAALARIAEHDFAIVLSDLRMPDLDGPALYAALARIHPQYLERIAFVTGDTMEGPMRQFLERVGRPWLDKPIRPDEVRALVAELVHSNRSTQEPR